MPKVTIAQLIEASEKNGYPWAHTIDFNSGQNEGPFIDYKTHKVVKTRDRGYAVLSCVVGQGVINLNGAIFPEVNLNYDDPNYEQKQQLGVVLGEIYQYNDREATSYEDAVRFMKEKLEPFKNFVVKI